MCLFKLCLVITKRANQTVSSALSKRPSQPRDGTSTERPPPVTCGSAHTICLWSLFKLCQGGKQAHSNWQGMLASVVIMSESYPVSLLPAQFEVFNQSNHPSGHKAAAPPCSLDSFACEMFLLWLCYVFFLLWVRLLSCNTFTPMQTWFLI